MFLLFSLLGVVLSPHMSHDKHASENKLCCEPGSITGNSTRNQCRPQLTQHQCPMHRFPCTGSCKLPEAHKLSMSKTRIMIHLSKLLFSVLPVPVTGTTIHLETWRSFLTGSSPHPQSKLSTSSAIGPLTFLKSIHFSPSQPQHPSPSNTHLSSEGL